LPDTRKSLAHKFDIQGHEGYIHVGFYEDGRPGELFITMAKEGSTIGGIMDAFGTAISIGLQYGVPLNVLVEKFSHSRFDPSGFTKNPDIPLASSIVDYIFRWLGLQFIQGYRGLNAPQRDRASDRKKSLGGDFYSVELEQQQQFLSFQSDAPVCDQCGSLTVRSGNCYRCHNCGNSLGCS
jgi:ribonucleoside-diphosphate reductase alpha chain